jgi:hypothetical protein
MLKNDTVSHCGLAIMWGILTVFRSSMRDACLKWPMACHFAIVALGLVVALIAFERFGVAATQGSLGATSTGSINISVKTALRAQLSGLADITLTGVDPSANLNNAQSVCAWTNSGTGYTITATGSGAASAFLISPTGGATPNTVAYAVQWAGTSGQTSGTALTAGTASSTFTSAATSPTCAGGTSASLIVNITSTNLQTMIAGTAYTGTLTLLMTPL